MPETSIQASFNSGEWSPKLFARVDVQKYRSGAALLQNFFVDYRGGASTRPGTKYILQCYKSATAVRLIPFQASFDIGYVLEFGDRYIRFFFDGAPVLETAKTITTAAAGPPEVFGSVGHGYSIGDWLFIQNAYYIVATAALNTFTLTDLFGVAINTNPFTIPASAQRVYTITSPYAAADLALIKFAQNVNALILCHPSYAPYVLTLVAATSWTLLPITFGATATTPSGVSVTPSASLTTGSPQTTYYSYAITAVGANGQESAMSTQGGGPWQDQRVAAGSVALSWNSNPAAISFNIYRANYSYNGPISSSGQIYGYIGSATTNSFVDDNIAADFSTTPPVPQNPFQGSGLSSATVTNAGTYTTVPVLTVVGASTIVASVSAVLQVQGTPTIGAGGAGYAIGDTVSFSNGVVLIVATVAAGAVLTWQPAVTAPGSPGSVTSGSTPANPVAQIGTSGAGLGATANLVWGVGTIQVTNPGAGYVAAPAITASPASTFAATTTLSASSNGYPSVPGFFQQRLVLAAATGAPQTFYMSKTGDYYNFDVSQISQDSDSISGTLVSGQLNTIRSMVARSTGLLILTDRNSWIVNGGSNGSAVAPSSTVANAQSFNGVSDVPPIVANYDVLYVQAKGSIVRDSAFNFYSNVYTGTDISVLSSHLFYGYTITEWAWAEEPFKVVWAVRSDGTMLTLTFLKEQEFIGWAHSVTNGSFKSVATVVEDTVTAGEIDAIYTVVQRTVQGQSLQYIERIAERTFLNGVEDAWCVDCGIGYSGAPATNFSGAQFLAGLTVTGLADGVVIPAFVMPTTGAFTLTPAASKVTIGLGFTCDLQTLPLELGEPTVQGKVKKINYVDVRVADTLGLSIGSDFTHLTVMNDLVVGQVSSTLTGQSSQIVTDLVNGDATTYLDPTYTIPGQYCLRQSSPIPATILGVIPNVTIGDGGRRG